MHRNIPTKEKLTFVLAFSQGRTTLGNMLEIGGLTMIEGNKIAQDGLPPSQKMSFFGKNVTD